MYVCMYVCHQPIQGSSELISRDEIVSRACLRLQSEEATEIAKHIVTQLTADADAVPDGFGQSQANAICEILIGNRRRSLIEARKDRDAALSLREQLIDYMREDVEEFFQSRNSTTSSSTTTTTTSTITTTATTTTTTTSTPTYASEGETLFELLAQKYDFESLNLGLSERRRAWLSRSKFILPIKSDN